MNSMLEVGWNSGRSGGIVEGALSTKVWTVGSSWNLLLVHMVGWFCSMSNLFVLNFSPRGGVVEC